jgi:hypothetical protein
MTENPKPPKPASLQEWLGLSNAPNWAVARPLGVLFGASLILLFVLALLAAFAVIFSAIISATTPQTGGPNLGVGTLIVALLGAPFLIWRSMVAQTTVDLQKEGLMTDRISKAVEQLGAEKTVKRQRKNAKGTLLYEDGKDGEPDFKKPIFSEETVRNTEVRIGGLLSLERIAQDSVKYDKGRDHVRVMEILCAYVRENAPASGAKNHDLLEWEPLKDDATEAERAAHLKKRHALFGYFFFESKADLWTDTLTDPRQDIAIALRIIGRRDEKQRLVEAASPNAPDAKTILPFDQPCPVLPHTPGKASLSAAALTANRNVLEAWQKTLRTYPGYCPDLRKTNLQMAHLSDLTLSGADLRGARMEGANLFGARMEGADLRGARMHGAILFGARMEGAILSKAGMEGAMLWGAGMEGADLTGARLQGAFLSRARFNETTSFNGAEVSQAAVKEVDLSMLELTPAQVNSAFGDASVTLPGGITPQSPDWPAHWPKQKLGNGDFVTEWEKWLANPETYTPP